MVKFFQSPKVYESKLLRYRIVEHCYNSGEKNWSIEISTINHLFVGEFMLLLFGLSRWKEIFSDYKDFESALRNDDSLIFDDNERWLKKRKY